MKRLLLSINFGLQSTEHFQMCKNEPKLKQFDESTISNKDQSVFVSRNNAIKRSKKSKNEYIRQSPKCNVCCLIYIQNSRMSRNQAPSRPVANMFALNRLRKDCYYQPIRVDFSPIQRPSHQIEQIIPRFNRDGLYFTSAFNLPRQRITSEQELNAERSKFQSRCAHYERHMIEDKTPEYRPTDNNYCQLCEEEFACYWEHINGKYHKRMINKSRFNRDIVELCRRMEKGGEAGVGGKGVGGGKRKTIVKVNLKGKNQREWTPKQECQATTKESLITMDDNSSSLEANSNPIIDISPEEQKKLQESLKITLQLGNHSTNLLSSNTFKDIFKNNT